MPLQEYTVNTRDAIEGQLYGLQQSSASIMSGTADNAISFARGVSQGAKDRSVLLGQPTLTDADKVRLLGVSLRQVNREQEVRAGDGTITFAIGTEIPVLRRGQVNVKIKDSCAVGGAVHMDKVTGMFYGAAGAGLVQVVNAQYRSTGSVDSIVVLEITESPFEAEVIA